MFADERPSRRGAAAAAPKRAAKRGRPEKASGNAEGRGTKRPRVDAEDAEAEEV